MLNYLLMASIIIFASVLLSRISARLGVPTLLAFIFLGMLFGIDGIFKIDFYNFSLSENICSFALIFIMFYGGFGTKWKHAKPVASHAALLSTAGVLATASLTGLFSHFVLGFSFIDGMILGAILSPTDAAAVFSVLRSKKLNLKYGTASLLELESGSNDPFAYMLTMGLILLKKSTISSASMAYFIFAQLAFGVIFGVAVAYLGLYVLRKFRFVAEGFESIFVIGIALLAYAAPSVLQGNGYLSVYIVGIFLGNHHINGKKALVHFFDGLTGLMQVLIFFLLGLLSTPSMLPGTLAVSIPIALFLSFVSRPAVIFAIGAIKKTRKEQSLLVSWAGLRGASSIVFAIVAFTNASPFSQDIFHIVFGVVLFSISLQGSLLAQVANKVGMIDKNADVMKTFTDYSDEIPVQFIQFNMNKPHNWLGKSVSQITLPPDTILVSLQRDSQFIVPRGSTTIELGDKIVMCANSPKDSEGMVLSEIQIHKNSKYVNKRVSDIPATMKHLVVVIQREGRVVIPSGDTKIIDGDILLVHEEIADKIL